MILYIMSFNINFYHNMLNSIVIFTFTSFLNLISAISLIIYENSHNDEFNNWFKSNSRIVSIFTLLSATNIEELEILVSKFAVLKIFSIIFTSKTKSLIFWIGILIFILK